MAAQIVDDELIVERSEQERNKQGTAAMSASSTSSKAKSKAEDAATTKSKADSYFGDVRLRESDVLHTDEDVVMSMKNVHKTYLLGVVRCTRASCAHSLLCRVAMTTARCRRAFRAVPDI